MTGALDRLIDALDNSSVSIPALFKEWQSIHEDLKEQYSNDLEWLINMIRSHLRSDNDSIDVRREQLRKIYEISERFKNINIDISNKMGVDLDGLFNIREVDNFSDVFADPDLVESFENTCLHLSEIENKLAAELNLPDPIREELIARDKAGTLPDWDLVDNWHRAYTGYVSWLDDGYSEPVVKK